MINESRFWSILNAWYLIDINEATYSLVLVTLTTKKIFVV